MPAKPARPRSAKPANPAATPPHAPTVRDLAVRWASIASLAPYARNARTHSPEQVQQLVRSIREFGWTNPVLVDGQGGIIAGHGRVLAAQSLGFDQVPVIEISHLTDAQKRAYILADNQLALNAGWDEDLLRAELDALRAMDFELDLLGFSGDQLSALAPAAPKDADLTPDPRADPVSRLGDVWILGRHKVICGDCTARETYAALLGDERIDCTWTDPPYNVGYGEKSRRLAGDRKGKAWVDIENDQMDDAAFREFLGRVHARIFESSRDGAPLYVAHSDLHHLSFRSAALTAGFKLAATLIWRKDSLVIGRSDYQWIHEPILYGWKPGARHSWFGARNKVTVIELAGASPFTDLGDGRWAVMHGDRMLVVSGAAHVETLETSVIEVARPKKSGEHPTMKPVELVERMLRNSARGGALVLDPFGGSGTTLMAAERLQMHARLAELDPVYVDVILRRWQNYTGKRAAHARTGAPFPLPPEAAE